MNAFAVCALAVAAWLPSGFAEATQGPASAATQSGEAMRAVPWQPNAERHPYRDLFAERREPAPSLRFENVQPATPPNPSPRVVCGMLIVPADPTIDPKMAIAPPDAAETQHTMRVLPPPACR